jgi:hypothetical protein
LRVEAAKAPENESKRNDPRRRRRIHYDLDHRFLKIAPARAPCCQRHDRATGSPYPCDQEASNRGNGRIDKKPERHPRAGSAEMKPWPYQSQGQKQDANEPAQRVNRPAEVGHRKVRNRKAFERRKQEEHNAELEQAQTLPRYELRGCHIAQLLEGAAGFQLLLKRSR